MGPLLTKSSFFYGYYFAILQKKHVTMLRNLKAQSQVEIVRKLDD